MGPIGRVFGCFGLVLAAVSQPAWAGVVSADYTRVETGNLTLEGATSHSQAWEVDVSDYGPKVSANLRLKVYRENVVIGIDYVTSNDEVFQRKTEKFAKVAAGTTSIDPFTSPRLRSKNWRVKATYGTQVATATLVTHTTSIELTCATKSCLADELSVELTWQVPDGGSDLGAWTSLRKEYCVDSGTEALLKKTDGVTSLFLRLPTDKPSVSLRIRRETPISLCGTGIAKVNASEFLIKDVRTLARPCPILISRFI